MARLSTLRPLFSMNSQTITIFVGLLLRSFLIPRQSLAGDAIAVGYNERGVWTSVTYNRSSTPKGGPHYHMAVQARVFAMRDLRVRANPGDLAYTKIIGESDQTGYVTVAGGTKGATNTHVTAIGRGKSQAEADEMAFAKLKRAAVTADEKILYQYFSYGEEAAPPQHAARIPHKTNA
jgi:hypothetical protein